MIYVCSLIELPRLAEAVRPSHLISLQGGDPFPPKPDICHRLHGANLAKCHF
jgi:hypothetical protein